MKMPEEITEDQRSELHWAITDRYKALEKLEEDTGKKHAPTDGVRRLIKLYRVGTKLVDGPDGPNTVEETVPGLLWYFAPQPELPLESQEGMEREVTAEPDLFGGGAETGGGHKPGEKGKWSRIRRPGEPEHIGEIVGTIVTEESGIPDPNDRETAAIDAIVETEEHGALVEQDDEFAAAAAAAKATPAAGATPRQPDYSTTAPATDAEI